MNKELQIKDYPDFVKDTYTNAILNCNYAALAERKKQKQLESNISSLNSDVNNVKNELSEIKQLLTLLLNK